MEWYDYLLEVIDTRSFSNMWFWIGLAVVWSVTSHWVLGVPFDMLSRMRRKPDTVLAADVAMLAQIHSRRLTQIFDVAGLWLALFMAFVITLLAVLGFGYGLHFCQALLLIVFPLSIVSILALRASYRVLAEQLEGPALYKILMRHRRLTQAIGIVSIFVTAMWGMWQNLNSSVLGG